MTAVHCPSNTFAKVARPFCTRPANLSASTEKECQGRDRLVLPSSPEVASDVSNRKHVAKKANWLIGLPFERTTNMILRMCTNTSRKQTYDINKNKFQLHQSRSTSEPTLWQTDLSGNSCLA